MVIVTHDIDEAITMADRVLIMSQNPGQIVGELKVDLPWPRRHMDSGFQSLREKLISQFRNTDSARTEKQESACNERRPESAA